MNSRVSFKYWIDPFEEIPATAVYSMPVKTGLSDVSAEKLESNGFEIPPTPTYEKWKNHVLDKKRCGRCWASLRGQADLTRHLKLVHIGALPYFPQTNNDKEATS